MRGALYSRVTNEGQAGDLEAGVGVWADSNGQNDETSKYRLVIQPYYVVFDLNVNRNGNAVGNSTAQMLYGHCAYQKK